jgi:hypothetical protein
MKWAAIRAQVLVQELFPVQRVFVQSVLVTASQPASCLLATQDQLESDEYSQSSNIVNIRYVQAYHLHAM